MRRGNSISNSTSVIGNVLGSILLAIHIEYSANYSGNSSEKQTGYFFPIVPDPTSSFMGKVDWGEFPIIRWFLSYG